MTQYPCMAHGCPMVGAIFLSGSKDGVCGFHYGVIPVYWPRVTDAMKDWGCVVFEVNECRRVITSTEAMTDVRAQSAAMRKAAERLSPQVDGHLWASRLRPAGGEQYGEWGKRLERFLDEQILESVRGHSQRAAA